LEDHPLVVDPNIGDASKKRKVEEYTKQHSLLAYIARFWPDHFRVAKVKQNDPIQVSFYGYTNPVPRAFAPGFRSTGITFTILALGKAPHRLSSLLHTLGT
jgi:hypothetical protein